MTIDITITRDPPSISPPNERCRLCGLSLHPGNGFAEMFLVLYDNPEKIVSKHEGIRICEDCHSKLLLEAGFLT